MKARMTSSLIVLAAMAATSSALAQDEPTPEHVEKDLVEAAKTAPKKKDGIDWRLSAGATLNFSDNRSVIGQTDGSTLAFGFKLDGAVNYYKEIHELRNTLALAAAVTKTPTIESFVKSQDNIDYESIYLIHVTDWFGPFARVAWASTMFRGTDVRPGLTDYAIARLDGTVDAVTAERLTLTDSLMPSRFKESLGVFFQPVAEEPISVEFRVGAGGKQIFANGQLAVQDDDATEGVIEVTELDDVYQLGAEAVLELWGAFEDKKVTYKAGAEAMTPFLHNDLPAGDNRSAFELTNLAFKAGLSFKLVDWASLDYEFKAIREPQLLDEFQIQNNLLLTMGLAAGTIEEK